MRREMNLAKFAEDAPPTGLTSDYVVLDIIRNTDITTLVS